MSEYCFMIQPFGGRYDKLYDQVYQPAIVAAKLDLYRVDRDPEVVIPIDDIERRIRGAAVCLADISEDNANVWFELGFALASSVAVCLVCDAARRDVFPFDVRHRNIIKYDRDSPADFVKLRDEITSRVVALVERNAKLALINADAESGQPDESSVENMSDLDLACLVVLVSESGGPDAKVSAWQVSNGMEGAGYNQLGSAIGLRRLLRMVLVSSSQQTDRDGDPYMEHGLTEAGWDKLEGSLDRVSVKQVKKKPPRRETWSSNLDDEIPF